MRSEHGKPPLRGFVAHRAGDYMANITRIEGMASAQEGYPILSVIIPTTDGFQGFETLWSQGHLWLGTQKASHPYHLRLIDNGDVMHVFFTTLDVDGDLKSAGIPGARETASLRPPMPLPGMPLSSVEMAVGLRSAVSLTPPRNTIGPIIWICYERDGTLTIYKDCLGLLDLYYAETTSGAVFSSRYPRAHARGT